MTNFLSSTGRGLVLYGALAGLLLGCVASVMPQNVLLEAVGDERDSKVAS